ncbi:MAG: putative salt-induced outer membrane protein YdiY [Mariniblastus sp.]|jgi:putative salt-induced outer membrane protein YdiY
MKPLLSFLVLLIFTTSASPAIAQLDYDFAEGELISETEPRPWTGSVAAGLNGKSGNSQSLDINATINLARDTDFSNTTLLATYFYSANDIATVTDRFFGQARQERKLQNPRWNLFVQGAYEWDRFKAFDYRIALHSGIGFEVYKNDDGFLKLRFGGGASKEVGGVNDEWIPELQFGSDWERQLTETVKLFATVDYFPNIENFSDFRLNTRAGMEFVVDTTRNINFQMFAFNRHDSTPPAGNVENDIDYGMALVVGF